MPKPFPREFRDDVVRVARSRDGGVTHEQVAADFEIHPMTLSKWLRQAAIDDGTRPGTPSTESDDLRAAPSTDPPVGTGERGAAPSGGVSVAGEPSGKMMYPLVRELA